MNEFISFRNTGRDFLLAGKMGGKLGWHLVMGAGGIYVACHGLKFSGVVRNCRSLWLDKFRASVVNEGIDSVMASWFQTDILEEMDWVRLSMEARADESIKGFEIGIDLHKLPKTAIETLEKSEIKEQTEDIPWKLWIRTRKRTMGPIDEEKAKQDKEKGGRKLIDLLFEVKPSCTIGSGWGVENLWVVGEIEWESGGDEMMARAWRGVEIWPFIGLDCEGSGIWYQVCWYGQDSLEVVIFGPSFFPLEMMNLLECKRNWILGKNVHDELKYILDSKTGWNGLDLAVLTRDLKHSDHVHNGLGAMIESATGQNVDKIKNPKKYDQKVMFKFGYIRSHNWSRKLDGPQMAYAGFDVAAPHIIIYDYLLELLAERDIEDLDKRVTGFQDVFNDALKRMVDRELDCKKSHVMHAVPQSKRNLKTNHAAIELSIRIDEHLEGLAQELPEERRMRMVEKIKANGQEKWSGALQIWIRDGKHKIPPVWMKHPELRNADNRNMAKRMKLAEKSK